MQKRGDRVAPPPGPTEWDLRFADTAAARGWDELCAVAAGAAHACWVALRERPTRPTTPNRQHRLKGSLGQRVVGGRELEQWQYEVTGGGRVWYCPDQTPTWSG